MYYCQTLKYLVLRNIFTKIMAYYLPNILRTRTIYIHFGHKYYHNLVRTFNVGSRKMHLVIPTIFLRRKIIDILFSKSYKSSIVVFVFSSTNISSFNNINERWYPEFLSSGAESDKFLISVTSTKVEDKKQVIIYAIFFIFLKKLIDHLV